MVNPPPSAVLPFLLPNYENSKSADGEKKKSSVSHGAAHFYNFYKVQPQTVEVCHSAVSQDSQSNLYGIHSLQAPGKLI